MSYKVERSHEAIFQTALWHSDALGSLANFTSSTLRLKSRWDWADFNNEAVPGNKDKPE